MTIKIYNTLTRRKQEFEPIKKGRVGMYVCGPTVYDAPHIGHARSAYVFDVIRRYFEYKKYKVTFVRNVTDVDDKIINKAKDEFKGEDLNSAVKKVSDKYLKVYHKYMDDLDINRPDKEPKATEYIGKMKDFIAALIERHVAYESDGDVYFNIKKAKKYGKLSNQSLENLKAGVRISPGEHKRDPLDFVLWKRAKEGEPYWDSPWGHGRPGWHIECSVMSLDILGDEFDIHGGGIDLIFPHHENEIAQSEGAGKKFARFWIHNGLLTINKEKMAKSSGNFITVEQVLSKYSADLLKILFLQTHYSHPVDFSWERMEEAKKAMERFYIALDKHVGVRCPHTSRFAPVRGRQVSPYHKGTGQAGVKGIAEFRERFEEAMDDDFNTPSALAVLFDLVTYVNKKVSGVRCQVSVVGYAKDTLLELGKVLGLFEKRKTPKLKIEIKKLIDERNKARKEKDFKAADKIRKDLDKLGVLLEDNKDGTTWRLK